MTSLRSSTQSMAAYRSSSSQLATPSSRPRELVAVSARSPRATASLEPGSITWATSIAVTRSRVREGVASMSFLHAEPTCGAQHRRDMPVRQAAGDLKGLRQIQFRRQPLERAGQRIDLGLGPVRQVGQGAVLHLPALAVAFPQQDGRRRPPIRNPRHIHVYFVAHSPTVDRYITVTRRVVKDYTCLRTKAASEREMPAHQYKREF